MLSYNLFKQLRNAPRGQSVLRCATALPHKFVRDASGKIAVLVRLSPQITRKTKTATYFDPRSIQLQLFACNRGFDYSVLQSPQVFGAK